MDQQMYETPNGYVIQLYQFARRYRYNYTDCINYFNYLLEVPEHNPSAHPILGNPESKELSDRMRNAYMTFGDFDILEVVPTNSFRGYHDVSDLAKKYLGRRQSVLLYSIKKNGDTNSGELPNIIYDSENKYWKSTTTDESSGTNFKRFFCLSMLSVTNEAHENVQVFKMLPEIKSHILSFVAKINERSPESKNKLECEIFGALNATEIGIVWLCNQYVDVLQVIDYIKHMKIHLDDGTNYDIPLFLATNTTIATKLECDLLESQKMDVEISTVRGTAFVQISIHDMLKKREDVTAFAKKLVQDLDGQTFNITYSAGEYDIIVQMPASHALSLMQNGRPLNNSKKSENGIGLYQRELREILRNNTQLTYTEENDGEEQQFSQYLTSIFDQFEIITVSSDCVIGCEQNEPTWSKDGRELIDPSIIPETSKTFKQLENNTVSLEEDSNYTCYCNIRKEMARYIRPSAGVIDMLDLLYADYLSTIASAYNKLWVSDFHRQFKAVLHAIALWMDQQGENALNAEKGCNEDDEWNQFKELTNAFKQQVYHLSQSSRMVLDIPRCHFRMTGQYDLLVHMYYGFAKIILEAIYLMQGKDHQSELIPLITVNTVPQVKSQLYFEYGSNDEMRVINLDIPASIVFDPQRGLRYLVHELFHYAVPQSREQRNYSMACFLLSEIFKMQFIHIFNQLLYTTSAGTVDEELKSYLCKNTDYFGMSQVCRMLFFCDWEESTQGRFWLDDAILKFVQDNARIWQHESKIGRGKKDVGSTYSRKIHLFCGEDQSAGLFSKLCEFLFEEIFHRVVPKISEKKTEEIQNRLRDFVKLTVYGNVLDRMLHRLQYCYLNKEYHVNFFKSYRPDMKDEENIGRKANQLWDSVREACADIAMVSLTDMSLDEYLLFSIQAWNDFDINHTKQISSDRCRELRMSMVMQFFNNKGIWNLNHDSGSTNKNKFLKNYVWFYASKGDIKNLDVMTSSLCKKALEEWNQAGRLFKEFQSSCSNQSVICYFQTLIMPVLNNFNVIEKSQELQRISNCELKGRLEEIQHDITENVYKTYREIIDELISSGLSQEVQEASLVYRSKRFQHDLMVAQHFQHQKTFRELADINKKMREYKADISLQDSQRFDFRRYDASSELKPWCFHAHSLTELLFYLSYCEKAIQSSNPKEPIWFRGQPSDLFLLTPSIMRRFDGKQREKYASLRHYQQCEFEEFKYRADGAPELPTGVRFTTSDYIALMQHYFVPTTLLDWSENAFSSLYFALEDYFENRGSTSNVALYLFQPKKYNKKCRDVNKRCRAQLKLSDRPLTGWIADHSYNPKASDDYSIPNLSTKANEQHFQAYLLGNEEFDDLYVNDLKKSHDYAGNELKNNFNQIHDLCLPFAIWTSRLNTRIRSQSGIFVAFNLYTPPEENKQGCGIYNHAFDYMSLDNIQRQLRKDYIQQGLDDPIFLYKITIDHACCKEVTQWLRGMGISRSSVYPELEGLKERF